MSSGLRRMPVRLDMTPMVDIAFLLLIFYMATTQFKPPEAKSVELPESQSQIELPDKDAIHVTITTDTTILIDWIEPISGETAGTVRRVVRTTVDGVGRGVRQAQIARLEASGRQPFLVMKADRRVPYGIFDSVATALQKEDLNRFLMITDAEPSASHDLAALIGEPPRMAPEESAPDEGTPVR